ncbi:MAG: ATP-dependent helicase RecG [Pseudomonadota bacterium]
MSQAVHPFSSLLGPLRYACQRDFAQLATVKQLRPVLEAALTAGERARVDARLLSALRAELVPVDSARTEERKASLVRLLGLLRDSGVALPAGLPVPSAAPAAGAVPPPRNAPPPKAPAVKPEEPPAAARGRVRRKPSDGDHRSEARLLSIAPREGPLSRPLKELPGRMNPRLLAALEKKGVKRVGDVLFLLPRTYEDRRHLKKIRELVPGEKGVTVAVVKSAGDALARGRRRMFRAVLADETGSFAVTYFQAGPWLKGRFPLGKRLIVSGELRATPGGREMAHPEVEPLDDDEVSSLHFGRVVPIYPGFERHEQRSYRQLAARVVEGCAHLLKEPLPDALRAKHGLLPLQEAIRRIHFPTSADVMEDLEQHATDAHQRLAFDELFFLQLGMQLRRVGVKTEPGIAFNVSAPRLAKAREVLPFQLTRAQARVVSQIASDMGRPEPMHRLLQGDVGSGKTAVALASAMVALQDGYQVALMAPTEILADQHLKTALRILGPHGIQVGLITASGTAKEKRERRAAVASGETRLAIGTHALIQGDTEFEALGLAIIDEQHRFGVIQRHALMSKGLRPDVLVMTATPIPRTLAMTLYGDLEVSVIDELPPGRTPIQTRVFSDKQRARVYEQVAAELRAGHQAYVVYPLVEESEKIDLADATKGVEQVSRAFPDFRVGLLHGRMSNTEKDEIMGEFRAGRVHVLVCTTVVEVGVDVPNASVMVIEHAERFGLSQLHQLRGRVGRGAAKSYCLLVSAQSRSEEALERLAVMERSSDGFVIAEKDLEIRGPGEFLGTRQSGMPELAVANLARDVALLDLAQAEAKQVVGADPRLEWPVHRGLRKALEDRWEGRLALARVG